MTNQTIARRYAKALLAIGQEDGNFEQYGREMTAFVAVAAEASLTDALTNPLYPADVRRKILGKVLARTSLSKIMQNFLELLQDKGRISQIALINADYLILVDEVNNVKRATITTAGPINEAIQQRVKANLEALTGKTVFVEARQDPDIIGGIIAQVGDLTLDGSVKTQLKNLKESLIKG